MRLASIAYFISNKVPQNRHMAILLTNIAQRMKDMLWVWVGGIIYNN